MERNLSRNLMLNLVALLLVGAAAGLMSIYLGSATGCLSAVFVAFGFASALLSWVQLRLRLREEQERQEFDELQKSRGGSALFSGEHDTFRAQRARMVFEKWVVPGFTILLLLSQGAAACWLWRWLGKVQPPMEARATTGMALYGLFALIFFLLGKYAAGIAQHEGHRLVRPAASYLLLGAMLFALTILTLAVAWFGYPRMDLYLARGLVALLALAGIETGVNLVMEIYRPRSRGQTARLLYESRLLGLLGQPEGLVSTAAQALDYQFGFKVSETWFYRYLERALAWMILLQATAIWLFTTFVMIDPHEQGLLERFGRYVPSRGVLEPGLHFKLPWPIDSIQIYSTREIHNLNIGFVPDPKLEMQKTLLWTRPHYKEEYNLLVASREESDDGSPDAAVPVNLLTVSIPVQYDVTDLRLWAYQHADPAQFLEKLATREVVNYLVTVDIEEIMSTGRLRAARELRELIQKQADVEKLGINLMFVGLQDIHPPVQIADAYEAVIGATQERETKILNAQAYQAERVPVGRAEAARKVREAEGARVVRVAAASGQAGQFTNQMRAFAASPLVYTRRAYLDTIVRGVGAARKFVISTTNTDQAFWLDLEDKLRPDLLDITVPPITNNAKKP